MLKSWDFNFTCRPSCLAKKKEKEKKKDKKDIHPSISMGSVFLEIALCGLAWARLSCALPVRFFLCVCMSTIEEEKK